MFSDSGTWAADVVKPFHDPKSPRALIEIKVDGSCFLHQKEESSCLTNGQKSLSAFLYRRPESRIRTDRLSPSVTGPVSASFAGQASDESKGI